MAKNFCDLCQQESNERDMRFGVMLCQDCLDSFSKAMSGDADAVAYFLNPQNFPNATEFAQKRIVSRVAGRTQRIEELQQEKKKQPTNQNQNYTTDDRLKRKWRCTECGNMISEEPCPICTKKKLEETRESYAQSIGVDYEEKVNPVATALTIIAWVIFIVGFVAGIVLGNEEVVHGTYHTYTTTEFSFAVALIYWCVSLVSGTTFLGFAEIIKLLDAIKKK